MYIVNYLNSSQHYTSIHGDQLGYMLSDIRSKRKAVEEAIRKVESVHIAGPMFQPSSQSAQSHPNHILLNNSSHSNLSTNHNDQHNHIYTNFTPQHPQQHMPSASNISMEIVTPQVNYSPQPTQHYQTYQPQAHPSQSSFHGHENISHSPSPRPLSSHANTHPHASFSNSYTPSQSSHPSFHGSIPAAQSHSQSHPFASHQSFSSQQPLSYIVLFSVTHRLYFFAASLFFQYGGH